MGGFTRKLFTFLVYLSLYGMLLRWAKRLSCMRMCLLTSGTAVSCRLHQGLSFVVKAYRQCYRQFIAFRDKLE